MVAIWGWGARRQLRQRRYILSTLVLRHLGHASILTALVLLLELLVVECLLLLLLRHVAAVVGRCTRHGGRWLRHARDVVGGSHIVATINSVLAARFRSVQAGLDQVLAFGLGDKRLKFGSCEGVDETSLRNDQ